MRLLAATLILTLCAPTSGAEEDTSDRARSLYEQGMAHFQLAEYDEAIRKWQDGFRTKPEPEFLYNLGQAYRLSNRPDKALQSYQAYLRMAPEAANRPEVERRIAALQVFIAQNPHPSPPPAAPTGPAKPEAPSEPTSPPRAFSDGSSGAVVVASAPARRPLAKRPVFWGVLAAGVVVVAGAVTLGVVLGTRDQVKTIPGLSY